MMTEILFIYPRIPYEYPKASLFGSRRYVSLPKIYNLYIPNTYTTFTIHIIVIPTQNELI